MKFTKVILIAVFFVVSIVSITPPIWPDTFQQSFFIQFNDSSSTLTTGKFWYDSTVAAQRYDFDDGKTKFACGVIYSQQARCSLLTKNHTLYIILPERNLCCNGGPAQIVDKNWLQNYTYIGEISIDGEGFYEWTELVTQQSPKYFADKSDKRIPRRWSFKRTIVMDYLKNSYSEQPIQQALFTVPSYCQKECSEIIKQTTSSQKEVQQKISALKIWKQAFRQKVQKVKNLLHEE